MAAGLWGPGVPKSKMWKGLRGVGKLEGTQRAGWECGGPTIFNISIKVFMGLTEPAVNPATSCQFPEYFHTLTPTDKLSDKMESIEMGASCIGCFHHVGQCICLCRCIDMSEGRFHYAGQCIWPKAASIMLDNISVYVDA